MYGGTIEKMRYSRGSVCYGGGVAGLRRSVYYGPSGIIKDCYAESDYIDYFDPKDVLYGHGRRGYLSPADLLSS